MIQQKKKRVPLLQISFTGSSRVEAISKRVFIAISNIGSNLIFWTANVKLVKEAQSLEASFVVVASPQAEVKTSMASAFSDTSSWKGTLGVSTENAKPIEVRSRQWFQSKARPKLTKTKKHSRKNYHLKSYFTFLPPVNCLWQFSNYYCYNYSFACLTNDLKLKFT